MVGIAEAAELTGYSERQISRLAAEGEAQKIRVLAEPSSGRKLSLADVLALRRQRQARRGPH